MARCLRQKCQSLSYTKGIAQDTDQSQSYTKGIAQYTGQSQSYTKRTAQDTGQSQSYTFALNDSALENLELNATKIIQDQQLPVSGSKKDKPKNQLVISKTIRFWHLRMRILNEGTKLPAPNKRGNEIEKTFLHAKKSVKSEPQPINGMPSSESLPSSDEGNKECSEEDDMEIKFDLTIISTEL
ncbi:19968_t:CDS:2 [Gigaspora rosea]|nr:19968_t:CDS:2 [Gigaspora rosea]